MSHTATGTAEFGFVESLPKGAAREVKRGVDAFREVLREYEAAQARHGVLVPCSTVAEALGVSAQRVDTLIDENRMRAVLVSGRRWVVADSVVEYLAAGPKQTGRPRKVSRLGNSVRVGQELATAAASIMERG